MTGLYQKPLVAELAAGVMRLLPHWGLSPQSRLSLLSLSENATFLAQDPARHRPLVLRVHRPAYHSLTEILSELDWIAALHRETDLALPEIVAAQDGARVLRFEAAGQIRHVVASEFLPGAAPQEGPELVQGFALLGEVSAELHAQSRQWQPPAGFRRKSWDIEAAFGPDPIWGAWRGALGLEGRGRQILERAEERLCHRLRLYGRDPSRFGLIHADLRLANLLRQKDGIAVIDFDDCGFSWYLYDLAAALSFMELSPLVLELIRAWIAGYQRRVPLAPEDLEMIPSLVLYRRFLLTAWISTHAETETAQATGLARYTEGTVLLAERYLAGERAGGSDPFALWRG